MNIFSEDIPIYENPFRHQRKVLFEDLDLRIKQTINLPERKRRSLPNIKLTSIEIEFLKALIEGRNKDEISTALKLLGEQKSYCQILSRLIRKFDALTLPNAIYKAVKMGILK